MPELCSNCWKSVCSKLPGWMRFTLQPAAGAKGELTGLLLIRAHHEKMEIRARKC